MSNQFPNRLNWFFNISEFLFIRKMIFNPVTTSSKWFYKWVEIPLLLSRCQQWNRERHISCRQSYNSCAQLWSIWSRPGPSIFGPIRFLESFVRCWIYQWNTGPDGSDPTCLPSEWSLSFLIILFSFTLFLVLTSH